MVRGDFIENPVVIIQSSLPDYYYRFHQLQELVVAYSPDTILQKLARIETAVNEQGLFAAGFISYDAAPAFDAALKIKQGTESAVPLFWFGLFKERVLVPVQTVVTAGQSDSYGLDDWQPSLSRREYDEAIGQVRDNIAAGETYQVNFSFRMRAAFRGAPLAFFADLIRAQRPNYGAFIETADFAVCSASPELFFTLDGSSLTSRPMKGTAARGLTQTADLAQAAWLQQSTKNRAENVMIVDMIRNDIGRVAETGSVAVPELFTVERYPTLWQMTSAVTGRTQVSITDILTALFPCASITGAPKVSTMRIIADLETESRQLYTGCIGYFGPGRQAQFNVAIRTATVDKGADEALYGVGGGIVWDSITGDEYEECQVKARILTERQPSFKLLETMVWTPDEGVFLFEEHLERLVNSADYFGFPIETDSLEELVTEKVTGLPKNKYKIRLLVDEWGQSALELIPLDEAGPGTPKTVRIGIGAEPVSTKNVFLYHKTTHRSVYEQARASRPNCDDVLLWNEKGEITETSIANIVLDLDGRRVTPPVESGLLAGTFRQYLIAKGEIEEQVIKLTDLDRAKAIWLVNSVQGWRRAKLVDQLAERSRLFAVPQ